MINCQKLKKTEPLPSIYSLSSIKYLTWPWPFSTKTFQITHLYLLSNHLFLFPLFITLHCIQYSHSINMAAHFLFTFSLLLLMSSAEATRQLVEAPEVAKAGESEKMVVEGVMIGSRPPSCEGRCSGCGHCEAVQVPLAPRKKQMTGPTSTSATVNSRGDEYSSNYKPMNWRCRCGDRILNP